MKDKEYQLYRQRMHHYFISPLAMREWVEDGLARDTMQQSWREAKGLHCFHILWV
jgi:hypothetical protein